MVLNVFTLVVGCRWCSLLMHRFGLQPESFKKDRIYDRFLILPLQYYSHFFFLNFIQNISLKAQSLFGKHVTPLLCILALYNRLGICDHSLVFCPMSSYHKTINHSTLHIYEILIYNFPSSVH